MYMVHAKPVFPVPARTGMASSTEAASENGVSLFHAVVKIYADLRFQPTDIPLERTISWCWNEYLVRANRIEGIRATAQAPGTVCLGACRVTYSAK